MMQKPLLDHFQTASHFDFIIKINTEQWVSFCGIRVLSNRQTKNIPL